MIGFPFDSHVTFESDGTPVYDRAITSAPLRKLIGKIMTDGVLAEPIDKFAGRSRQWNECE